MYREVAAEKYTVWWGRTRRKIQGKLWYAVTIAISGEHGGEEGENPNAAIRKIVKMKGYRTGYRRRPLYRAREEVRERPINTWYFAAAL